jgi:hypothetical protein
MQDQDVVLVVVVVEVGTVVVDTVSVVFAYVLNAELK